MTSSPPENTCLSWWGLSVEDSKKSFLTRDQLKALLLGQLGSILLTGTGTTSELLAKGGVEIPTTQSALNYFLLAVVFCSILLRREGFSGMRETFKTRTLYYLPLALIDVESNFLIVKAYQYTTLASVTLLDCFTIPCAVLGTYLLFKTKYNLRHVFGIVLCIAGLVLLVYYDIYKPGSPLNVVLGDSLVLLGAVGYAICNVGAEYFVKDQSMTEYLGMVGFWGFLCSVIQLSIFERKAIGKIVWSPTVVGLMGAYSLLLFFFYTIVPVTIGLGGAALWNLSLLTSDVFTVLVSVFVFKQLPSSMFYAAFTMILVGLLIFNIKNDPHTPATATATTTTITTTTTLTDHFANIITVTPEETNTTLPPSYPHSPLARKVGCGDGDG
eukprot:TRINITY_DN2846_c0_g2_i17.p1 TRINITY_DN2846_c0_g2~~TRINITY_DN2846_c0_g2_i17.p1  ORF type:complete len:384 (+),score=88.80 TRINITY_DN2846_c0_g2_i17:94-1245(+)